MRVDYGNCRTPDEEYEYWRAKHYNYYDPNLPWDMHPNELRALDMYKAKIRKKMLKAFDLVIEIEHNIE